MKILLVVAIASCVPFASAETPFEKSAREKQAIVKAVTWPDHEPLMFYLRRGGYPEDAAMNYERQHAPENIKRMADAGVRYERLHFYKGFGLETEEAEIARTREMAERMHAHGMKVSLYVAGTMFIETFYREVPEAVRWEQRDQFNLPVPYTGAQTYRHFACRNEPAYREYLKRVLRVAVQDIKADEIFFDNIFEQAEPKSCRCPRCTSAFVEFLRKRYPTGEACRGRFGYPTPEWVRVSEWFEYNRPEHLNTIDDPVLQEWMMFRAETLARYCGELYDYVKSLNPKIPVGFNLKGIYGANRIWANAVYHPFFKGRIDFSPFDAGGYHARIEPATGAMVSELRSFKMARTLDFSYQGAGDPLEFALYMAFNPQKHIAGYGYEGGPNGWEAMRATTPEAEFFRAYNDRYYTETSNVADVAVLHTWPSEAYSVWATRVPTILMEQVLIQHHVPFDIIFDAEMDSIGRYQAVIVPGQESLSMEWVDRLAAFARNGGSVVFTGNTADYNERRQKRSTNPLRKLMEGAGNGGSVAVTPLGRGRLVYVPDVKFQRSARPAGGPLPTDEANISTGGSRSGDLRPAEWVLPANHEEIARAITQNLPKGASLDTAAPNSVVMELLNRPKTSETLVHVVNFDTAKPAEPFRVALKKQQSGQVRAVKVFSPDTAGPQTLPFDATADRIEFSVPSVRLYSMVVVEHE